MIDDVARSPSAAVREKFATALLDTGHSRIERGELWRCWDEADPAWAGTWAARLRLAGALRDLGADGVVELPAIGGRLWDSGLPALPRQVGIPPNRQPRQRLIDAADEPWTPAMSWAAGWIRTSRPPGHLRLAAAQINRWLLGTIGTQPARVARDERSLHIFDEEKRLAQLTTGPLFVAGRLCLNALHCDAPMGGLRIARLASTGPVLVLENKSTFDSAWRALRSTATPPYAAVVFGGGDAAASLVGDLAELDSLIGVRPTCVYYAGDVDVAGIEAMAAFADAGRAAGLTIEPALPLWHAVAQATPTGDDLTADATRVEPAILSARNLGLPEAVLTRLRSRQRVPQERIDRTALCNVAWWAPPARRRHHH